MSLIVRKMNFAADWKAVSTRCVVRQGCPDDMPDPLPPCPCIGPDDGGGGDDDGDWYTGPPIETGCVGTWPSVITGSLYGWSAAGFKMFPYNQTTIFDSPTAFTDGVKMRLAWNPTNSQWEGTRFMGIHRKQVPDLFNPNVSDPILPCRAYAYLGLSGIGGALFDQNRNPCYCVASFGGYSVWRPVNDPTRVFFEPIVRSLFWAYSVFGTCATPTDYWNPIEQENSASVAGLPRCYGPTTRKRLRWKGSANGTTHDGRWVVFDGASYPFP